METARSSEQRVVLVSGSSSGFGRQIVETLARRGHLVFAGLRDLNGRNKQAAAELRALVESESLELHVVELDVTDQYSANEAVKTVVDTAGRIDAVVNNAGMIMPGPLEAFTSEEAHRQFDVNVFGALRLNRAALPQLREQGHGVLIQMGSLGGHVTIPYSGLYSASKAALGSLSEAWHHELSTFGIESVIVEPSSYRTNIGVNAVMPEDMGRMGVYGERLGRFVTELNQAQADADMGDIAEVVEAVVQLVEEASGQRSLHTLIGPVSQVAAVEKLTVGRAEASRVVATDMGVASFLADL